MRKKTRAITPRLLDLFRRQERGTGTFDGYTAWHRIRRSDPSRFGRSNLMVHGERQLDLLTNLQLIGYYFATQLPGLLDVREQFPLSLCAAPHELCAYDVRMPGSTLCPGTLDLASELRLRHPQAKDGIEEEPKPLVANLLLTLGSAQGEKRLMAVSLQTRCSGRPSPTLRLQAQYWQRRDVPWLLITPAQFCSEVGATLQRIASWALGPPVPREALDAALSAVLHNPQHSMTRVLQSLQHAIRSDVATAQRALWQAVWQGRPTVDLRRGWRPHLPLRVMDAAEWWALNPLASRRSAWNL